MGEDHAWNPYSFSCSLLNQDEAEVHSGAKNYKVDKKLKATKNGQLQAVWMKTHSKW